MLIKWRLKSTSGKKKLVMLTFLRCAAREVTAHILHKMDVDFITTKTGIDEIFGKNTIFHFTEKKRKNFFFFFRWAKQKNAESGKKLRIFKKKEWFTETTMLKMR